jgi:lipoprotein-releasing system ATP-binding protein
MTALLEARNLQKVYRPRHRDIVVLQDCAFSLGEGETVAVIGPSGAGKSTLLNLLGGLDVPTAGEILFRGSRIPASEGRVMASWRSRSLGFIFQFHFLLPDFSALENLLIPARMAGKLTDENRVRALHLLEELGLSDRREHLPGELSGGEQQRVAVARAFMNRPALVLADEPFGNLDHEKGRQLGRLLFELQRQDGTALVIVTHDLELADRADRILKLSEGRLRPHTSSGGGAS